MTFLFYKIFLGKIFKIRGWDIMKNKILSVYILLIFLLLNINFLFSQESYLNEWLLTPEKIENAKLTGRQLLKDLSLIRKWVFYSKNSKDYVIVVTPYLFLSMSAMQKYSKYLEINNDDISLAQSGYLSILLTTYGDEIDFAKDYYCVIKLGDKIIHPLKVENPTFAKVSDNWPYSPAYYADCSYIFSIKDIPRNSKVKIVIVKGIGKEESYDIDLSNVE